MHVTSEAVLKYVALLVPTNMRTHIIEMGSAGARPATMSQSQLPLVVPEGGLERRRDGAEEVPDAGHGLHPHCRHEHQPSAPGEGPQPLRQQLPHGEMSFPLILPRRWCCFYPFYAGAGARLSMATREATKQ